MLLTRRLLEFIDRMAKPVMDLFEKVEISVAGERWWVVGPKGSGKTVLHLLLSGKPVADTTYQVTGVDDHTSTGILRTGEHAVRHKRSKDFGGEYLDGWEEGVRDYQRFVFVYSLVDLDGSSCYRFNDKAVKPAEKYELDREDSLYENIMTAFTLAVQIISDNFSSDYSLPAKKRKLLIICNKTDLWPANSRPQFFSPYLEIVKDMRREVAALELQAGARFEVMYDACSFIAQPRAKFDAIMAKFLAKV